VLGREPFEQRIGFGREADGKLAVRRVLPGTVEDDYAAGAADGDEAREAVDELPPIPKRALVEDVVAIEEVEHPAKDAWMDAEHAYLEEVATRLQSILGPGLVGVYAGGSWALGGYEPGRSDLDVSVVVQSPLRDDAAEKIVAALGEAALHCPARGLELVVYTAESARAGSAEPGFELNFNTGAGLPLRAERTPRPGERHWFAIDRSVLAQHGVALVGPPAAGVFAAPPRDELRKVLAELLHWYAREDPDSADAVLNAGRSLRFARDGVWLPKPALRGWASEQPGANSEILTRTIAELEGS
jgi:hypothetical protein